jgi:hypothetical protein
MSHKKAIIWLHFIELYFIPQHPLNIFEINILIFFFNATMIFIAYKSSTTLYP